MKRNIHHENTFIIGNPNNKLLFKIRIRKISLMMTWNISSHLSCYTFQNVTFSEYSGNIDPTSLQEKNIPPVPKGPLKGETKFDIFILF